MPSSWCTASSTDIVRPGLTIVTENPLYVEGNWNATAAGFGDPHAATSFIADAVTLLATGWNDNITYTHPYAMGSRNRGAETFVRAAIIAGKGPSFPQPAGTATDFGTDGGAHNFLRYLEDGNRPVNYRGSLVTFYYSRQATGTFKCCTTVYGAPTRNYTFDTDFLNPGAAATADAGLPRLEHARLLAGAQTRAGRYWGLGAEARGSGGSGPRLSWRDSDCAASSQPPASTRSNFRTSHPA